jgi:hypothetical protein
MLRGDARRYARNRNSECRTSTIVSSKLLAYSTFWRNILSSCADFVIPDQSPKPIYKYCTLRGLSMSLYTIVKISIQYE